MGTRKWQELDNLTFYSMLSVLQGGMWLLNDIEEYLRPYDMSHGRFSILISILGSADGHRHPIELARVLGRSKPTIARMIDRLEKDGYVQIGMVPGDQRKKRLSLTESAYKLLADVVPDYNKRISIMGRGLSDEEKYQLMILVSKINFLDPLKTIEVRR